MPTASRSPGSTSKVGGRPGSTYLEVGGALEGLSACGADMDALPAVRVLAMLQQHGGRGKGAATLQALVQPGLLLGLAALRQVGRHVSYLERVRNWQLYWTGTVCELTDVK